MPNRPKSLPPLSHILAENNSYHILNFLCSRGRSSAIYASFFSHLPNNLARQAFIGSTLQKKKLRLSQVVERAQFTLPVSGGAQLSVQIYALSSVTPVFLRDKKWAEPRMIFKNVKQQMLMRM